MYQPLTPDLPLLEAVRSIESSFCRIAVVTDQDNKVIGTLTDGDVRRCLLNGGNMSTAVAEAMAKNPITALPETPDNILINLLHNHNILAVPIVDRGGHLVKILHMRDLLESDSFQILTSFESAVIMAGGEGTRLRPLTETIPKPMVSVGGVPLLERQINQLLKHGIKRVYLSVNYLGHIIEDHFADGNSFGLDIRYLREESKLGTAGSLSLLPEQPSRPILVINGDILTSCDFLGLYDFHVNTMASVTIAASEYNLRIPYGIVECDGARLISLTEKPSQRFLCNTGIYALSPAILSMIPYLVQYNMTDLIASCLSEGKPVSVFPIHEFWSDIGTPSDLAKARNLFSAHHDA